MSSPLKIGFLGAGKMATALGRGFVQAGLVDRTHVIAADPIPAAREEFARQVGARTTSANVEVMELAQVVVLAVKPGQVKDVLAEVCPHFVDKDLLISIAAGVRLKALEAGLPTGSRVVRVMPNTPALVGASATAYALGAGATAEDGDLVNRLFSAVGVVLAVKEELMDAVTGLSGSGPAFVFMMLEALSDGGVAAGLPRDVSTRLATQTVLGAAKMALETGQHPAALKDMVTSPGGTTIEGVDMLEAAGVRGALMRAVRAAAEKSRRLGEE